MNKHLLFLWGNWTVFIVLMCIYFYVVHVRHLIRSPYLGFALFVLIVFVGIFFSRYLRRKTKQ